MAVRSRYQTKIPRLNSQLRAEGNCSSRKQSDASWESRKMESSNSQLKHKPVQIHHNASFIESKFWNNENKESGALKKFSQKEGRNFCSPSNYRKQANQVQKPINISNKQSEERILTNKDQNIKLSENYSAYYKTEQRNWFNKKHTSLAPTSSSIIGGNIKYNSSNYTSK